MTLLESNSCGADPASCIALAYSTNGEPDLHSLAQLLAMELRRGRHIVLWGQRGSGKTTLLQTVEREFCDVHHALSIATSHLDGITRTLERAYAEVPTQGGQAPHGKGPFVVGSGRGPWLFTA